MNTFEIVSAGVDPTQQVRQCALCHRQMVYDEIRKTFHIQLGYVTLCEECYNESGNDVR